MFIAIVVSLVVVKIYELFKKKNWIIKMSKQVPEIVSISFSSLIPLLISVLFFLGIKIIFENIIGLNIHEFIFKIITIPLLNIGDSYLGMIIVVFLINFLMSIGIHGTSIVLSITSPIYNLLLDENRIAFQLGKEIPHVVIPQFFNIFMGMGGAGNTLALLLTILFFAKSTQLKKISKLAIMPSFFNINEMVLYGLPVVLNPIMMFPFILNALVSSSIGYFFIKNYKELKLPGISTPWTTPTIVDSFLASSGNYKFVLIQVVCLLISILIYFPFVKNLDKSLIKDEEAKSIGKM